MISSSPNSTGTFIANNERDSMEHITDNNVNTPSTFKPVIDMSIGETGFIVWVLPTINSHLKNYANIPFIVDDKTRVYSKKCQTVAKVIEDIKDLHTPNSVIGTIQRESRNEFIVRQETYPDKNIRVFSVIPKSLHQEMLNKEKEQAMSKNNIPATNATDKIFYITPMSACAIAKKQEANIRYKEWQAMILKGDFRTSKGGAYLVSARIRKANTLELFYETKEDALLVAGYENAVPTLPMILLTDISYTEQCEANDVDTDAEYAKDKCAEIDARRQKANDLGWQEKACKIESALFRSEARENKYRQLTESLQNRLAKIKEDQNLQSDKINLLTKTTEKLEFLYENQAIRLRNLAIFSTRTAWILVFWLAANAITGMINLLYAHKDTIVHAIKQTLFTLASWM